MGLLPGRKIGAAVQGQGASWFSGGSIRRRFPGQESWSLAGPSWNVPKPVCSRGILFAALHVGNDVVGCRPTVILALHAAEIQVSRSQPYPGECSAPMADSEHASSRPMIIPSEFTFAALGTELSSRALQRSLPGSSNLCARGNSSQVSFCRKCNPVDKRQTNGGRDDSMENILGACVRLG